MSTTKEFFALVSNDKDVKLELGEASLKALISLLREKGLRDDARKTLEEVTAKVAEAHGFDLKSAVEKLDDDELDVAAGGSNCDQCAEIGDWNCSRGGPA